MFDQGFKPKLNAIVRTDVDCCGLLMLGKRATIRSSIRYRTAITHLFFVSVIFLLCIFFPTGCSDDDQDSSLVGTSETGSATDVASASLTIRWHETQYPENSTPARAVLDCEAKGVEHVVCNVYDSVSGSLLATGGPFACTDHRGTVENIPVGEDRTFVVLAEDVIGNVIYQGVTAGIKVNAGNNNQNVSIDAYLFVPSLISPDDDAIVDPNAFLIEWDPLLNAVEYLVQVAKDHEFNQLVIDQTTPITTFEPTVLAPSTEYYWKISGVDQYMNIGAESETRHLVTSDCMYSISVSNNKISSAGGSGSFYVSASSNSCAWFAVASVTWVTITSGANGTGDGLVSYSVTPTSGAARSATIIVAGKTYTIDQDGTGCAYTLSPLDYALGYKGGSYDVTVTATHSGCNWTASENYSWISLSPSSGSGNGAVEVSVSANTGGERSATITIAGKTHTIYQDPATGSLNVTIYPLGAVSAGARWRVDGGDWNSSGYTQNGLSLGNHTVEFNTIPGWIKPANQMVTLSNNQTTYTNGEYSQQTVIELSVYAYKEPGNKYADLTWSGANSTYVDVYRDDSIIATTPNDGAYTHGPFSAATPATYQICEAGISICSNRVTVNW